MDGLPVTPGAVTGRGVAFGGFGFVPDGGGAVGRGVGLGAVEVGRLITTREGDTVVSVADRWPAPDPLDAVNRYDQRPAGNFLV